MFIDEIKIYAKAGHGGKGAVAFHREAYITKGGPSGGNGGRGGSVILQADHDLNNLIGQYYVPRLIAPAGEGGKGKGMDGHAGKDLIIKVPCGTLVWLRSGGVAPVEEKVDDENDEADEIPSARPMFGSSTGKRPMLRSSQGETAMEIDLSKEAAVGGVAAAEDSQKGELIADLTEHGQQFVLCKGGRGGLGNRNFATPGRQTPRFAQPGEAGVEGEYLLELRIVAEVGLVGYPNAGKSRCSRPFPRRVRKSRRIRSPRCIRKSASWNMPIGNGSRSATCRASSKARTKTSASATNFSATSSVAKFSCCCSTWPARTTASRGTITNSFSRNWNFTTRRCSTNRVSWWQTKWTKPAPRKN
ncbi:MAG TPA: hypothetical protein VFC17_04895 [Candidatus Limnocylindrales bacterium]|nr:hypothetical protein [Candidatus Limnocylindrales bacterium]